jgi:predicted dehydrogenase
MKKVILLGSSLTTQEYTNELARFKGVKVVGYIDPDDSGNQNTFDNFFQMMDLIQKGDAFIVSRDVITLDFEVIRQMIRFGKHVFIDGFREWSCGEIEEIEKLRNESRTVFQFGNTLFGLPIISSALQLINKPRFIRVEKHGPVPKKGQFDNWIFENLSEEFDLMQRIMKSPMRSISARPMFLFGEDPDLLNVHIEFHNDAICHLSVGRAIAKNTHRFQVYQKENMLEIDLAENQLSESRMSIPTDQLSLEMEFYPDQNINNENRVTLERHISPYNARKLDLQSFIENIDKQQSPSSNLTHLLEVADMIEVVCEKVKRRYQAL